MRPGSCLESPAAEISSQRGLDLVLNRRVVVSLPSRPVESNSPRVKCGLASGDRILSLLKSDRLSTTSLSTTCANVDVRVDVSSNAIVVLSTAGFLVLVCLGPCGLLSERGKKQVPTAFSFGPAQGLGGFSSLPCEDHLSFPPQPG